MCTLLMQCHQEVLNPHCVFYDKIYIIFNYIFFIFDSISVQEANLFLAECILF